MKATERKFWWIPNTDFRICRSAHSLMTRESGRIKMHARSLKTAITAPVNTLWHKHLRTRITAPVNTLWHKHLRTRITAPVNTLWHKHLRTRITAPVNTLWHKHLRTRITAPVNTLWHKHLRTCVNREVGLGSYSLSHSSLMSQTVSVAVKHHERRTDRRIKACFPDTNQSAAMCLCLQGAAMGKNQVRKNTFTVLCKNTLTVLCKNTLTVLCYGLA